MWFLKANPIFILPELRTKGQPMDLKGMQIWIAICYQANDKRNANKGVSWLGFLGFESTPYAIKATCRRKNPPGRTKRIPKTASKPPAKKARQKTGVGG